MMDSTTMMFEATREADNWRVLITSSEGTELVAKYIILNQSQAAVGYDGVANASIDL
jgi:hypothetical protein